MGDSLAVQRVVLAPKASLSQSMGRTITFVVALARRVRSRVLGARTLAKHLVLHPRGKRDDSRLVLVLLEELLAGVVGARKDIGSERHHTDKCDLGHHLHRAIARGREHGEGVAAGGERSALHASGTERAGRKTMLIIGTSLMMTTRRPKQKVEFIWRHFFTVGRHTHTPKYFHSHQGQQLLPIPSRCNT
jgi:hypothetical protein